LPGYYGFQKENSRILNPSYVILSAYRAFSRIDDQAFWEKAYHDGIFLVNNSQFGELKLTPDWISVNKNGISMWEEKKPVFGYEAIRTILYLSWEMNPKFPEGVHELFNLYEKLGYFPLYVDLAENSISLNEVPAGFYAIYARAAEKSGRKTLSRKLLTKALEKATGEKDDYYSMSLLLLALQNVE
jgi:endoglucanase